MAFTKCVVHRETLDIKSWREYNFYIQYLNTNIIELPERKRIEQIEEGERYINNKIKGWIREGSQLNSLMDKMKEAFQTTQLTLSDFKWNDKKEDRFWNWVWCYLKNSIKYGVSERVTPSSTLNKVFGNKPILSNFSGLSLEALSKDRNNSSDRITDIIKAFHDGEADRSTQLAIIKFIDEEWKAVYKDKVIVEWLDKSNHIQWSWTLAYIEKNYRNLMSKAWRPGCDIEIRAAIIAAMDMLNDPIRKELLVGKLKRAWSQKKFRDKSDGKKAYSIHMTPKTKSMLDELAGSHDLKLNEVVAKLIKQEHELINK